VTDRRNSEMWPGKPPEGEIPHVLVLSPSLMVLASLDVVVGGECVPCIDRTRAASHLDADRKRLCQLCAGCAVGLGIRHVKQNAVAASLMDRDCDSNQFLELGLQGASFLTPRA